MYVYQPFVVAQRLIVICEEHSNIMSGEISLTWYIENDCTRRYFIHTTVAMALILIMQPITTIPSHIRMATVISIVWHIVVWHIVVWHIVVWHIVVLTIIISCIPMTPIFMTISIFITTQMCPSLDPLLLTFCHMLDPYFFLLTSMTAFFSPPR